MHKEGYLNNIYYRYWQAPKPIANVFSIHGMGGHCLWFDKSAELFNKHQINHFSFDLPGFGQSKYTRGTIDSYYTWIQSTKETLERFLIDFDVKSPVFVLGHSLGALIAILLSKQVRANGWILSVPGFEGHKDTWPFFKFVLPVLIGAVFQPNQSIIVPFGPDLLTRNKETQRKVKSDPFRVINPSACIFMHVYFLTKKAQQMIDHPQGPVLMLQAGEDKVCSNDAMNKYFEALKVDDKCKKSYTNSFHDLFIEDNLEEIVSDISSWIKVHV